MSNQASKQWDARYYLFGAYFKPELKNKKLMFPSWHQEKGLGDIAELQNVRPLPFTPVAVNIDTDTPMLLASDKVGLLTHLGKGRLKHESSGTHQTITPDSPVHALTADEYSLTFPPLSALAQLAVSYPDNKALCQELAKVVKAVKVAPPRQGGSSGSGGGGGGESSSPLNSLSRKVKFAVTEILPSQLAPAVEKDLNGSLKPEDQAYNEWLANLDADKPLKGFMVPTIYCCAVAFSSPEYTNATVQLLKFDPDKGGNGEYVAASDVVKAAAFGESDTPCAVFHLDPAQFTDGMYTIRVNFLADDFEDGFPPFLDLVQIDKFYVQGRKNYQYELREYIKPSMTTPFGKMAILCGDMISLEESVLYQYPQLEEMRQYLAGELDKTSASPASAADSPMNAIWETGKGMSASAAARAMTWPGI